MQNEIRTINVLSVEEAINSMGENRLQEGRKAFELDFEKSANFFKKCILEAGKGKESK